MDEETRIPTLTEVQSGNKSIPIPDPSFLLQKPATQDLTDGKLFKHSKEYEKFCEWVALPKEERKIKTIGAFEKKYGLAHGYTKFFRRRKDFHAKRLAYFWDWMWDNFPDVVHSQLKMVKKNGNTAAARFFAEIISKNIDTEKPPVQQMQNFMLVGVDQARIDGLFAPKEYVKNIKELTPDKKDE